MELSDMMSEMGYENVSEICERRKQVRDCFGLQSYEINLCLIQQTMDFKTGYFADFRATCLIIADRLYEFGVGLAYYIHKNTSGQVLGVFERYDNAAMHLSQNIDFVIYYGYQHDYKNYEIIKEFQSKPNPPHIVMVASIDSFIIRICRKHNIIHQYDKYDSLSGLIKKLQTIQQGPKLRVIQEEREKFETKK